MSLTNAPLGYCFRRLPLTGFLPDPHLSERDSAKTYPALSSVVLPPFQVLHSRMLPSTNVVLVRDYFADDWTR